MTRILGLLGQDRAEESEVARCWDAGTRSRRSVDWGEFRHGVASLHARLSQEHSGAWILLTEDAYSFAVGLFALWHAGCHAILPPNRQPHSLAALQTRAAGVLSDQPNWFASGSPLHPLRDGKAVGPTDLAPLRPDALSVELFTSGTTGDEKPVVKRIAHLEAEVDQLEACWGEQVEGSTFFSTASHQHLYGLLFGVLWPLCTGRPFDAQHLLHAGELVPRMHEAKTSVLASVPTSLKHLARHAGAKTLRDQCHAIFSSGGPLPTDTAHAVARVVGHAPIEVLGSTETGGIAWRSQEPETGEALWTPFPCARVTRDAGRGVLRVSSPLVSVEESGEGFATGDRIELLADGRFRLGGRSDQIVKVGEKRLDLTRMASQLRGHEWLEEAVLTTIDRESEQRVAAVVVASERGADVLRSEGRRAFTRDLREALAGSWDPVLHPRYWRIVPRLPENTQGKVTREALGQLFQTRGIESGSPDRPEVLEELRGSDFIERACVVPKDLECFAGHFPERVLVPGVLQLDWAMDLLALLQGHAPVVEEIESLKLIAPLDPGMKFRLNVRIVHPVDASEATPGATKMEFTLWSEEEKHSIGRVRLAPSIDVTGAGDPS